MGAIIKLPGYSVNLILQGSAVLAITASYGNNHLPSIRTFCKRRAGLFAANRAGSIDDDDDQPGDDRGMGRIFPLGNTGFVCTGKRSPFTDQSLDSYFYRVGWNGSNVCMVEIC